MKIIFIFLALILFVGCHDPEGPGKTIDVRIAFGYKDARPARFVGDRYERLSLVHELIKSCRNEQQICGFRRDPTDADIFEKVFPGPSDQNLVIRLHITASSAGPDDETNRKNPYQTELSRRSEENFINGLRGDDAVFYVGHSRDGGGPDFTYPKLNRTGHVDYQYYKRIKPGLERIHQEAGWRIHTPALGLISCASRKLFTRKSLGLEPRTELITVSDLLYYSDALELVRSSLLKIIQTRLATTTGRSGTKVSQLGI